MNESKSIDLFPALSSFGSRIGKKNIQKSDENVERSPFIPLTVSLPIFKSCPFNLSVQFCSFHWGNGIDRCGAISWFSEALLAYRWSCLIKGTGTQSSCLCFCTHTTESINPNHLYLPPTTTVLSNNQSTIRKPVHGFAA